MCFQSPNRPYFKHCIYTNQKFYEQNFPEVIILGFTFENSHISLSFLYSHAYITNTDSNKQYICKQHTCTHHLSWPDVKKGACYQINVMQGSQLSSPVLEN